jgi:hypothetical protein
MPRPRADRRVPEHRAHLRAACGHAGAARRGAAQTLLTLALSALACGDDAPTTPECGSFAGRPGALLPGVDEPGFDAALARHAHQYDRQYHALNALSMGLNTELFIPTESMGMRELITTFLRDGEGFDLLASTGTTAASIGRWSKAAGAYAGAGIAADAFRYGTLRDSGQACADVDTARAQLVRGLEGLHRAVQITGAHGVIARSLAHTALPYAGTGEVTPLADSEGRPLPLEKDNGTWRADLSGQHPDWIWEDSASRDMLIGWALGQGAAWEVMADDDTVPAELKARLAADALAIGQELRKVRASGFDLEVIDADGRITFHGYLHERAFERGFYLEEPENGFNASLALGTVAVCALVSGDTGLRSYLIDELVRARRLPEVAATSMLFNDLGDASNFSGYNMAFTGVFLALRYVDDARAEATLRVALEKALYAVPDRVRQPSEMKQSFFDFVYAAGLAGRTRLLSPADAPFDAGAVARGSETLREFPAPPYWDTGRTNCDAAEIAAARCTLEDGTVVELLGDVGRGEKLVAATPIPMRVRPPSNYWWRSNPYAPNGDGEGAALLSGVDFRLAYWMGRWIK